MNGYPPNSPECARGKSKMGPNMAISVSSTEPFSKGTKEAELKAWWSISAGHGLPLGPQMARERHVASAGPARTARRGMC